MSLELPGEEFSVSTVSGSKDASEIVTLLSLSSVVLSPDLSICGDAVSGLWVSERD